MSILLSAALGSAAIGALLLLRAVIQKRAKQREQQLLNSLTGAIQANRI